MKIYLIDGVQVTEKTWLARQQYGEHAGAKFEAVVPPIKAPEGRR